MIDEIKGARRVPKRVVKLEKIETQSGILAVQSRYKKKQKNSGLESSVDTSGSPCPS